MPPVDPKAGRVHASKETDAKTVSDMQTPEVKEIDHAEKQTIADRARKLLRTHLSLGKKTAFPSQGEGKGPKPLSPGLRGRFPVKSPETWKLFFANVLQRGSAEKTVSRQTRYLVEGLFRGTYPNSPGGTEVVLVSDLHFEEGGEKISEKFARILLPKPKNLEKCKPGDPVPADEFQEKGEMEYVQIRHQTLADPTLDSALLLSQLKNPSNQGAQARMEKSLVEERNRRSLGKQPLSSWIPFGGDPRPEREKRPGKPRLWTFLSYSLTTAAALILIYTLFRFIF